MPGCIARPLHGWGWALPFLTQGAISQQDPSPGSIWPRSLGLWLPGRQLWPAVRLIPQAEPAKGQQSSAGQLQVLLGHTKVQLKGVRRSDERARGSAKEEKGREQAWGGKRRAACCCEFRVFLENMQFHKNMHFNKYNKLRSFHPFP